MDYNSLLKALKAKKFQPIYLLMGEESFFIDALTKVFQNEVLPKEQQDFNLSVVYGKDVTVTQIIAMAKRFPMMSDYQVVIVKEAQELARSIDTLESYVAAPNPTTILVLCYKYKKIDKRKKIYKSINKSGVVFESKKLYDNQVGGWIEDFLHQQGFQIVPKATYMLVEFLGTDLQKISNELSKLAIVHTKDTPITPEVVETHIGISKDFNIFELTKAIGVRDVAKSYRIVHYFIENPKEKPLIVTISMLFTFFSKVMQYHAISHKNPNDIAAELKVNRYFIKDYAQAAKQYPMKKITQIIHQIKIADLKSKGLGMSPLGQEDILKELLVVIFANYGLQVS